MIGILCGLSSIVCNLLTSVNFISRSLSLADPDSPAHEVHYVSSDTESSVTSRDDQLAPDLGPNQGRGLMKYVDVFRIFVPSFSDHGLKL